MELPGPRARYWQLADRLRGDIYAGAYPQGSTLPAEAQLAERYQMSRALVNRALQLLAADELVSQEQGRGTYVSRRRPYRVTVELPRPAGAPQPGKGALAAAVAAAAAASPAVTAVESAAPDGGLARVTLLVEAAGPDHAARAAALVVRAAVCGWPGDGWDLALAWIAVGPV